MPKYKAALVACARWEENDIVEWIEYHRSIGFEHIFLYSNDDDPYILYRRVLGYTLGEDPFITYLHWPKVGEQIPMYLHFIDHFLNRSEWISFLDIDEFITVKSGKKIYEFLTEDMSGIDCVYFNWLIYGNAGKIDRDCDSILLSHNRRSARIDVHTKTIFKTEKISPVIVRRKLQEGGLPFTHFWDGYEFDDFKICSADGTRLTNYGIDFPKNASSYVTIPGVSERIIQAAYVAHFQFKSEQDFLRRVERGGFAAQSLWGDLFMQGKHKEILDGMNEVEDNFLRDYWSMYTNCSRMHIPARL